MNSVVEFPTLTSVDKYTQLELEFNRDTRTLFSWMKPEPRPCFNTVLVEEIARSEKLIELHRGQIHEAGKLERVDHVVFASRVPGVFNLGGDLALFIQAILRKDRETLTYYASLCVENVYRRVTTFGAPITTIALVQGKALGGGFECALASDLIIAERSATFALPEVLFNLFPGMGALSLLARRVGLKKAEDIICSGQVFSAKEMRELGIVDEIVEDGLGLESTRSLITQRQRRSNTYRSLQLAKRHYSPISLEELMGISAVWVDSALALESRDMRMMARLIRAQEKLVNQSTDEMAVEALFASTLQVVNG